MKTFAGINSPGSRSAAFLAGILLLIIVGVTGCWKIGGGSGDSANPVGSAAAPMSALDGSAVPGVQLNFVMPPDSRQSASILAATADNASPTVTIKLTFVNVGDTTKPTSVIVKNVAVTPEGTADFTLNNLPALPVIVEIIMNNCSKGGYKEFHGGADLVANRFNEVNVSPKGSKQAPDILAEVMTRLLAESTVFLSITSNFASQVGVAVAGLDASSSTVYESGVSRFQSNISSPVINNAILSVDKIVENPKTGSLMVSDEILVTFKNPPTLQEIEQARAQIGGELIGSFPELRTYQFRVANVVSASSLVNTVSSLQAAAVANGSNGEFETHAVKKISADPNDPGYLQSWGLQKIGAAANWPTLPVAGVGVAVIDTGIQRDHEDLIENIDLSKCINFASSDLSDFDDRNGHGTHVAGIIAAKANNSLGSAGVAPNARIIAINVFGNSDGASELNIAQAIKYAADLPNVRVINMSLGGPGMISRVTAAAIDYAAFRDKLVVVAAGNSQDDTTYFSPAHYERCFTVGATTQNDSRAYFSNYGLPVDIAAPGDEIYSCYFGGSSSYRSISGTSMAAPFVSGLAAAMFSVRPDLSADEARRIIQNTADVISTDRPLGSGRINMTRAMAALQTMTVQNPPMLAISGPSDLPAEGYADFTVVAADRDDVRVSFNWSSSGGSDPVVKFTADMRSTVTWTAPETGGQYVLTCSVTDSRGIVTTETHNVYVIPKPVAIELVEPLSGPAGTIVTISGYDFGESIGTSRVRFNGVDATEIISWKRTQIQVKVPAGAVSGQLRVVIGQFQSNGIDFLVNDLPGQPVFIAPVSNAVSVVRNPDFEASAFQSTNGSTHLKSDWEIYDANLTQYSRRVWEAVGSTLYKRLIRVDVSAGRFINGLTGKSRLNSSTEYWARVRYIDSNNQAGPWSAMQKFTTLVDADGNPPNRPSIVTLTTEQTTNPTLQGTAFYDADGDSHMQTDWEVYTSETVDPTKRVWYKAGDIVNLTSTRVRVANGSFENGLANEVGLLGNATYYVRVRYYDNHSMVSPWSELVSFQTLATPRTPRVTSPTPAMTDVGINPTLSGSAFAGCLNTDTHARSSWEIYDDPGMAIANRVWYKMNDTVNRTSIAVTSGNGTFVNSLSGKTALDKRKTYYARVKYYDQNSYASEWSDGGAFTIISNSAPNAPSVTYPAADAINAGTNTTLTINGFSDPDAGDTHGKTDWEIFNAANLIESSRVWSSIGNSTYKTSIVANEANGVFENDLAGFSGLDLWQSYWLRVRVFDDKGLGSQYSATVKFTVTDPAGAPGNLTAEPFDTKATLRWSAPTTGSRPVGYNIYHSTSAGFAKDSATKTVVADAVTSYQISNLQNGVNYYFRVYSVDENGEQAASNEVKCRPDAELISPNIGTLKNVPAGTFQRDADPANISYVSAFKMSQCEITRAQFKTVMGNDPSFTDYSSGITDPVQCVNWYHAIAFCNKLSLAEGLVPAYTVAGVNFSTLAYAAIPVDSNAAWDAATCNWSANGYRLPTEMEWMWAAMGADLDSQPGAMSGGVNVTGYAKTFAGYNGSNSLDAYAYAWYETSKTHPAGTKLANELGLYDMSGNVWEWFWDWYGDYPANSSSDYRGAGTGSDRLFRGGSWNCSAGGVAVANRYYGSPIYQSFSSGFRVVRP